MALRRYKSYANINGIIVCPDCHSVKHLGFAHIQGKGDHVREHLATINGWSQTQPVVHWLIQQWEQRSQFQWN